MCGATSLVMIAILRGAPTFDGAPQGTRSASRAARRSTPDLSADHESPPQRHQLAGRAGDRRQPEELRAAVGAGVVADADLGEDGTGYLELPHHLDADHARRGGQLDAVAAGRVGSAGSRSRCRARGGRTADARCGGSRDRSACGTTSRRGRACSPARCRSPGGPRRCSARAPTRRTGRRRRCRRSTPCARRRGPRAARAPYPRFSGCWTMRSSGISSHRSLSTATESSRDPSSTTMISKSSTLSRSTRWTSWTIFGIASSSL